MASSETGSTREGMGEVVPVLGFAVSMFISAAVTVLLYGILLWILPKFGIKII